MTTKEDALLLARELLKDNPDLIERHERPEYAAEYRKSIDAVDDALSQPTPLIDELARLSALAKRKRRTMTRDDVLRMAQEAGIPREALALYESEFAYFATKIMTTERKACELVGLRVLMLNDSRSSTIREFKDAIRARGEPSKIV